MNKTVKDLAALTRQNNACLNSLLRWHRKVLAQPRTLASLEAKEYSKATVEAVQTILTNRKAA